MTHARQSNFFIDRWGIGIILILYGIFTLLTPLTPGSWLALIGMEMLGIRQFIFRKFLYDKQRAAAEEFMEKTKSKFKRQHKDESGSKPDQKQP
jgi:hypothetical protein